MNNRIATRRCNTFIVTLASRVETQTITIKNTFNIARAIKLIPNESDPVQKMHLDAIKKCNKLQEMQKNVNKEEIAFQKSLSSRQTEISKENTNNSASTKE